MRSRQLRCILKKRRPTGITIGIKKICLCPSTLEKSTGRQNFTIGLDIGLIFMVEFVFETVSGLSLNGFSQQNVIFGLGIEKTDTGFRLTLDECYGLAGSIEAEKMSLRVTPGKPS